MFKPWVTVVRQLGGLGDVLMMSPVYRGLKEQGFNVRVIIGPYYNDALRIIAERNPFIDEILCVDSQEYTTEATKKWQEKRCFKAKLIEESRYIRGRLIDLNNACLDYEHRGGRVDKPRVKIWCDAAGVTPSSYFPIYETTRSEKSWAKRCFEEKGWKDGFRNVGIAPQSADPFRSISDKKALEIAVTLGRRGLRPILLGTSEPIADIPMAKTPDLSQLFSIIEQLDAIIAVDSGPLHIAGTMHVPIVGLFGPTDPAMRMGEYVGSAIDATQLITCAHCWYKTPCRGAGAEREKACLTRLPVDVVVEETVRVLKAVGK